MKALEKMQAISAALYGYDKSVLQGAGILCGVDEAGRGPLAGPVCCAAVILNNNAPIVGLNDSKKLSEAKREALYSLIIENCIAYEVALIDENTIDDINILNATMLGMAQCLAKLNPQPQLALIDGNRLPHGVSGIVQRAVVKGDATSAAIAAASILAKVTRDRYMRELAQQYPQYGFDIHKGYGTQAHYAAIKQYGVTPCHRKSFLKGVV